MMAMMMLLGIAIFVILLIIGFVLGIVFAIKHRKIGLAWTMISIGIVLLIAAIIVVFLLFIDRYEGNDIGNDGYGNVSIDISASNQDSNIIDKSFGTYIIPDGWSEAKELSNSKKFFYVKDGTDMSKPTSNVSVEVGTNKYKKENHMEFRQSMQRQLMVQASRGATSEGMQGIGTNTKNGDVMYVFTINSENTTTKQYYIVGDYRYVLIHETDFNDENIKDISEVAKSIAESFEWKD